MPTTFNPKITSAGLNAAIAANGAGLSLQLTHIALGSAKYNPTGAETALVNRIETSTIAPGSSAGPATLSVLATFMNYVGADYDLGEIGFFAGDPAASGTLFAVASRAGLRYAVRSPAVESYTPQFVLALSGVPLGSVNVTVDATGNVAASLVANHIAAVNPHPQYVRKAGDTMTGPLTLAGNAVLDLQAVTKQQLDSATASIVVLVKHCLVQNDFFAGAALSVDLALTPGTWLVDASAGIRSTEYYSEALSVDGAAVHSMPDRGDPIGTDIHQLSGFHVVVVASARNVPIAYSQDPFGTSFPTFIKAIAFKTA